MAKHRLKVFIRDELWRAVHIEALTSGVTVGAIIEDAIALYLAVSHGDVSIVTKPGVVLTLTTVRPSAVEPCEPKQGTKPVTEPTPVVTMPNPQPNPEVDATAPNYVRDNPWLAIISRRSAG